MNEKTRKDDETKRTEALNDLNGVYSNPIRSFNQKSTKSQFSTQNFYSILRQREFGFFQFSKFLPARQQLSTRLLPNLGKIVASSSKSIFCGQFSQDGQVFLSAGQDNVIRIYESSASRNFTERSEIIAEEVGWSILDTALAPDRKSLAYSTWSDSMYLITLNENYQNTSIIPLRLNPESHSFTIFSLQYSNDGNEIIGGSNDACVYVYDLVKQRRTLCVVAHHDDVNTVRFVDDSNSLIVSGSDDSHVSVWDRRSLNESRPKPVGIFAGHSSGITFVHSRMDTRYLISNSKDQSIKLWDMRRFADSDTIRRSYSIAQNIDQGWDYRFDNFGRQSIRRQTVAGDPSVLTYRGHSVNYTLIRCYFSPNFTTGQKYIITGSSDGCVRIYDVLTGKIERTLRITSVEHTSRDRCVRDVSWHPTEHYIISSSWDPRRSHVRWDHSSEKQNQSHTIDVEIDVKRSEASSPEKNEYLYFTDFDGETIEYDFDEPITDDGDDDDDDDDGDDEEDDDNDVENDVKDDNH